MRHEPAPKRVLWGVSCAALLVPASALYLLLDPQESRFPSWLAIYSVQFALYGGVALYLHRRGSLPIPAVLLCALAARVVL